MILPGSNIIFQLSSDEDACSRNIIITNQNTIFAQEAECVEIPTDSISVTDAFIAQAISYLDVQYVCGGIDENGFDCNG